MHDDLLDNCMMVDLLHQIRNLHKNMYSNLRTMYVYRFQSKDYPCFQVIYFYDGCHLIPDLDNYMNNLIDLLKNNR